MYTSKRTLAVFGCSFTEYGYWPTWSDWLANSYSNYIKLAISGTGIRAQFNRIVEFLNSQSDNELLNTDVVVQWSGLNRVDFMIMGDKDVYSGGGNVFNNQYIGSEFLEKYYSIYQQVYEALNYIDTAKKLLEVKKIRYAMTFMLDPRIDEFFGEPGHNFIYDFISYDDKERAKSLLYKFDDIIDNNFTDKCMTFHQLDEPNIPKVYCHCSNSPEEHPSPLQHYTFMEKYIKPYFNEIELNKGEKMDKCIQDWQRFAEIKQSYHDKKHLQPKSFPIQIRLGLGLVEKKYNSKDGTVYLL